MLGALKRLFTQAPVNSSPSPIVEINGSSGEQEPSNADATEEDDPRHTPEEREIIDAGFELVTVIVGEADHQLHMAIYEACALCRHAIDDLTSAKALIVNEVLKGATDARLIVSGGRTFEMGFKGQAAGIEDAYRVGQALHKGRPSVVDQIQPISQRVWATHLAYLERID